MRTRFEIEQAKQHQPYSKALIQSAHLNNPIEYIVYSILRKYRKPKLQQFIHPYDVEKIIHESFIESMQISEPDKKELKGKKLDMHLRNKIIFELIALTKSANTNITFKKYIQEKINGIEKIKEKFGGSNQLPYILGRLNLILGKQEEALEIFTEILKPVKKPGIKKTVIGMLVSSFVLCICTIYGTASNYIVIPAVIVLIISALLNILSPISNHGFGIREIATKLQSLSIIANIHETQGNISKAKIDRESLLKIKSIWSSREKVIDILVKHKYQKEKNTIKSLAPTTPYAF